MKIIVNAMLLAMLLAGMAACNTIGGVGDDVESVGDTISDEAEKAK